MSPVAVDARAMGTQRQLSGIAFRPHQRTKFVTTAIAVAAACTVPSCQPVPDARDATLTYGQFTSVVHLEPARRQVLGAVDTILSLTPDSAYHPAVGLAVAPNGLIALARPLGCQVFVLSGVELISTINPCDDVGFESISGMTWADTARLLLFDLRSAQVAHFDTRGQLLHRVAVFPQAGTYITAAFTIGDTALLQAYERAGTVDSAIVDSALTFLDLRDQRTGRSVWTALGVPALFRNDQSASSAYVPLCLQQGVNHDWRFLALNPWMYEVAIGTVGKSDQVVIVQDTSGLKYVDRIGNRFRFALGRYEVGCGTDTGVAMRTFARRRSAGKVDWHGTLGIVDLHSGNVATTAVTGEDPIARATALGLDNAGRLYALVPDSTVTVVVRYTLPPVDRDDMEKETILW